MIHRVHLYERHDLHIFVGWEKDIVHNFVACIQSYWFRKAACQSYAADFLLIFSFFLFLESHKNVLECTTTYYHVVSLFGPMSTNYHKHEIETEMRLFSFSFLFSLVLFLSLFSFVFSFCVLVILQRRFEGWVCLFASLSAFGM